MKTTRLIKRVEALEAQAQRMILVHVGQDGSLTMDGRPVTQDEVDREADRLGALVIRVIRDGQVSKDDS